jgi:hypothetical protein
MSTLIRIAMFSRTTDGGDRERLPERQPFQEYRPVFENLAMPPVLVEIAPPRTA